MKSATLAKFESYTNLGGKILPNLGNAQQSHVAKFEVHIISKNCR
jgi:hypothetical protein